MVTFDMAAVAVRFSRPPPGLDSPDVPVNFDKTQYWYHRDNLGTTDFLTAAQAAQRLGIKPATLYAYVSRGVLGRSKSADGRGCLFDPADVERLARRGRPRRTAGVADITVKSAITEITADNLRYRGLDATRLAVGHTFEEVAAPAGALLPMGAIRPARTAPGTCVCGT